MFVDNVKSGDSMYRHQKFFGGNIVPEAKCLHDVFGADGLPDGRLFTEDGGAHDGWRPEADCASGGAVIVSRVSLWPAGMTALLATKPLGRFCTVRSIALSKPSWRNAFTVTGTESVCPNRGLSGTVRKEAAVAER